MGVCAQCCCVFFPSKRGTCSDGGLTAPRVHARAYVRVCVGAARRLSLLCLPLSLILRLLQSSPQNRPLIIVWCSTGSAVRSYKQTLGVFIAGRGRLELCCIEADHRGEAWIKTFSAGREATGTAPVSRLFSSPAHMGVLFGPACAGQGWKVKLLNDPEIPCSEVCTHIHDLSTKKQREKCLFIIFIKRNKVFFLYPRNHPLENVLYKVSLLLHDTAVV